MGVGVLVPVTHSINVETTAKEISDAGLEAALKEFRKKLADTSGRKAFHIFTNKTLDELLEKKPKTVDELRQIHGLGEKKIEEFGEEVLRIIMGDVV